MYFAGMQLAICYQNERMKLEADGLIADLPNASGFQCDVSSDDEIAQVFEQVKAKYGTLHTVVHAVAYAPASELKGEFLETTREGFRIAHDVSCYSLIAVSRAAVPLMTDRGSIMTLTYFGAEKVVPHYNVMGVAKAALESTVRYLAASLGPRNIRVNAVSAGPIRTLAARGIGDFNQILDAVVARAPLGRNVEQIEVGNTALFLCSPLASGITGEITFVDCGFNITGV